MRRQLAKGESMRKSIQLILAIGNSGRIPKLNGRFCVQARKLMRQTPILFLFLSVVQGQPMDEVVNRKALRAIQPDLEVLYGRLFPLENAGQFPRLWPDAISRDEVGIMAPKVPKAFAKVDTINEELVHKVTQEQKIEWWEADYRGQCVQWTGELTRSEWPWAPKPGKLTFGDDSVGKVGWSYQVVVHVPESDWQSVRRWLTGKYYTYQATLIDHPTNREGKQKHLLLEVDWDATIRQDRQSQAEQNFPVVGITTDTREQMLAILR